MQRNFWIFFILTVGIVVLLDQGTKYLAMQKLDIGTSLHVIPGLFDLTLTFNKGAAFGLLADFDDGIRQTLLTAATFLALAVVFYFLVIEYAGNRVAQSALAMILGGAIGNIIDRARLGMVIDFLDFYFEQYHWPAFNLADSFICVGVAILLFCRSKSSQSKKPNATSSPN